MTPASMTFLLSSNQTLRIFSLWDKMIELIHTRSPIMGAITVIYLYKTLQRNSCAVPSRVMTSTLYFFARARRLFRPFPFLTPASSNPVPSSFTSNLNSLLCKTNCTQILAAPEYFTALLSASLKIRYTFLRCSSGSDRLLNFSSALKCRRISFAATYQGIAFHTFN